MDGLFNASNGSLNVARFNADDTLDPTFKLRGVNGNALTVPAFPDARLMVTGNVGGFATAGGAERQHR